MLGRADLVMVVLDRDPHRLERPDRVAPDSRRGVEGRLREVAALVERLGAVLVLEQEVLRLRADVEGVEAHRLHPLERASEREARVAVVRLAVRRDDVADHPPFQAVRQDAERRRIGDRDHVRLLDRVEARDRRAVEAHAVVERALQLAPRDREALQVPFEIGEPEQHVLDAAGVDLVEHGFPRLRVRRRAVLALNLRHRSFLPENAKSPGRRSLSGARGSVASIRRAESTRMAAAEAGGTLASWRRGVEDRLARLARAVSRRRRAVIAVWLVLLAGSAWFSLHQTDHLSGGGWEVPGSASIRVSKLIDTFPGVTPPTFTFFVTGSSPAGGAGAARGDRAGAARDSAAPARNARAARRRTGGAPAGQLRRRHVQRDRRGDEAPPRVRADELRRCRRACWASRRSGRTSSRCRSGSLPAARRSASR